MFDLPMDNAVIQNFCPRTNRKKKKTRVKRRGLKDAESYSIGTSAILTCCKMYRLAIIHIYYLILQLVHKNKNKNNDKSQTDRQTEGQTVDSIMRIADHACSSTVG